MERWLTLAAGLFLCLAVGRSQARGLQPTSSANTSNPDTDSCMVKWIQLLPTPPTPEKARLIEELFMILATPIDEGNVNAVEPRHLTIALGGHAQAEEYKSCLSRRSPRCRLNAPCRNAGRCLFSNDPVLPGYRCFCASGFMSKFCNKVIAPCSTNPCLNRGKCQPNGTSYICHCPPHVSGDQCQNKWWDESTLAQLKQTVFGTARGLEEVKQVAQKSRDGDRKHMEAFLLRLEQRLTSSLNNSLGALSQKVAHLDNRTQSLAVITEWWDESTLAQLKQTVFSTARGVEEVKQEAQKSRDVDREHMEAYLLRLEQRLTSSLNNSLGALSQKVADLDNGTQSLAVITDRCSRVAHGGQRVSSPYFMSEGLGAGVKAYCDRVTDGGGWTVFLRRQDGSVDFFRGWSDYRNGFGSLTDEFWLGLKYIHQLTSQAEVRYELRIDMIFRTSGERHHAVYTTFKVAGEADRYRLTATGFSSPTLVDRVAYSNGKQFSTKDRDVSNSNCPSLFYGGWWYDACHLFHPTGQYNLPDGNHGAVLWKRSNGDEALRFVEMKMRPVV